MPKQEQYIDQQPAKRGRPIDETKRNDILSAATTLFMRQGFTSTSMEQIAKEAGMSKLTLYRRFADKNALFTEVISRKCRTHIPDELFDIFGTVSVREAIKTVGAALFSLITSPDATAMHRMMMTEAPHNSEMTELFYNAGPKRVKALVREKMQYLRDTGKLNILDPGEATEFFCALFSGSDLYMRNLLNIGEKPTEEQRNDHVNRAVDFFMRAYAPSDKPRNK